MLEWLIVRFLDLACVVVGNFLLVVLCYVAMYVRGLFDG
jgi:hypothetical protein